MPVYREIISLNSVSWRDYYINHAMSNFITFSDKLLKYFKPAGHSFLSLDIHILHPCH
jgi:hypothetical protein